MFNHLPPSSHECRIRQSNSSGLRRLNRGSCCTPKFALSFLKAFLTKDSQKIQAYTSTIGFFQHQAKEETVKNGKADKNILFDKIEGKTSFLRFHIFRLGTLAPSMQALVTPFV